MTSVEIHRISAVETYDLRARVLRDGNLASVRTPDDDLPGAWHLGARRSGRLVGVASFYPQPCPCAPDLEAVQLRFMAVDPPSQGGGVGRELLDHAVRALRHGQVPLLWANGRDTALGFYERAGFSVVGEGFIHEPGLPHHLVTFDLSSELTPHS